MQGSNTIDTDTIVDINVCHADTIILVDDCHIGIVALFVDTRIQLTDDGHQLGNCLLHEGNRPFLECLRKNRVVRVCAGL